MKILVGINVDQMFAEAQRKGMMFYDKMTEEELKHYLQTHFSKESTSCEWKEFKNLKHFVKGHEGYDIISYQSAISNMEGGHLVIGVEDKTLKDS